MRYSGIHYKVAAWEKKVKMNAFPAFVLVISRYFASIKSKEEEDEGLKPLSIIEKGHDPIHYSWSGQEKEEIHKEKHKSLQGDFEKVGNPLLNDEDCRNEESANSIMVEPTFDVDPYATHDREVSSCLEENRNEVEAKIHEVECKSLQGGSMGE